MNMEKFLLCFSKSLYSFPFSLLVLSKKQVCVVFENDRPSPSPLNQVQILISLRQKQECVVFENDRPPHPPPLIKFKY